MMLGRSGATCWLLVALFLGLLASGVVACEARSSQRSASIELPASDGWIAAKPVRDAGTWDIYPPILFDGAVYLPGWSFDPIPDEIVLPLNPGSVRVLKALDYDGIGNWSIDDFAHFRIIDRGSRASGVGYDIGTAELLTAAPLLVGNYPVTVSVSDTVGLTSSKTILVVVTLASGIPFLAIVCGLAALVVGVPLGSVATVRHRRRIESLKSEPAGGGVLLEETAAGGQVSGRVSEPSVLRMKRQDYRLPRRCPDCGAPVIWDDIEWVGPLQAKCRYCGAPLEATLKGV